MSKLTTLFAAAALLIAGTAHADVKKAEPAKPAKPAEPAKPAVAPAPVKAEVPVKPAEPPKMEMPTVPQELTDMAKTWKGTWKCKGSSDNMDGSKATWDGTAKWKAELDGFWLVGTFEAKKSKTNPFAYKGNGFRTYDAKAKKWTMVGFDNMGGWGRATSTGPAADGKTTFEGEGQMMGMTIKSKDYEQWVKEGKEIHIWGEMSMDGKTWMPVYDMTCKK